MNNSLLPNFEYSKIQFSDVRQYVEQNWVKIFLVCFGLYIILVKDINLQLSMNSANQESETDEFLWEDNLSNGWEAKEAEKVSTGFSEKQPTEFSVVGSVLPVEMTGEPQEKPNAVAAAPSNLANTFSNLTFIMSPTYAKRKNIPPHIVEDKKRKCANYVTRFAPVAIAEMKKYGIPASITLAQGLLESNVGDSRLVRANKNHFGIKCFSKKCKKGHCANFTDDTHKDFFRVYPTSWDSYRAHSIFLQGQRYRHLKNLGTKNYQAWAHGLRKAGYATDKNYAKKLIQIIETLNLQRFDEE